MNITLKATVQGNYKTVIAAFDRKLFEALKPSVGKMEILSFTGSKKGDKVHIKFISPIKTEWKSDIVEDNVTDDRAWFVDVGTQLPWPLATWTHKHIVEKVDKHTSVIIDEMTFTGKNILLTLLIYPAIYVGFYPRKKIYQSYFKKVNLT